MVKFTDLKSNSSTVINGSYITTGTIDANKVTVKNLNASYITSGTIDASKITVKNLNASYITSGTIDASKITVNNLNASNITSGKISGDRISGGIINAVREIRFQESPSDTLYARIFGNAGEYGAGLKVSAGGIFLSGGSINYLNGNWFVQNGDLEIENGNLVLNSGYKIKCDGIISTYIGCTSITASSNIDCSGAIYGKGNIGLDRTSIWTALDGTLTRDVICFNSNMFTSSSDSSKVFAINTAGNFVTLRAGRLESGGDVTCWNLWASNKVYANNVALTSDQKLKTDIKYVNVDEQTLSLNGLMSPNVNITTEDMHEFIETLPMISYRLTEDLNNNTDFTYYGFLAQDILYTKVGSELIEYGEVMRQEKDIDEDGKEIINYKTEECLRYSENKFIAFICGALQKEIQLRKELEEKLDNFINNSNN